MRFSNKAGISPYILFFCSTLWVDREVAKPKSVLIMNEKNLLIHCHLYVLQFHEEHFFSFCGGTPL